MQGYLRFVKSFGTTVPCLKCGKYMFPSAIRFHMVNKHGGSSNVCPWCYKYKWKYWHETSKHVPHMIECLKNFVLEYKGASKPPILLVDLQTYIKHLKIEVKCHFPNCDSKISVGKFERHFREEHRFISNTQCVWCLGNKQWTWGKKGENVSHLQTCFEKFMANDQRRVYGSLNMDRAHCEPSTSSRDDVSAPNRVSIVRREDDEFWPDSDYREIVVVLTMRDFSKSVAFQECWALLTKMEETFPSEADEVRDYQNT